MLALLLFLFEEMILKVIFFLQEDIHYIINTKESESMYAFNVD